eukprot:CAMPEP_0195507722 /NCGR_PEP_ID=MMETSP0794_2-20130614/1116_1 /TAXON_ID=515487 /ORGANISM="Stephanopyxis turris, Strain CCMP 815" /LENGTH=248 /DNA_ID=CAMNT_0040634501 /DNA_START=25 /DNA_END=768 /DNA_ORIENTATION=+
MAPYGSPSKSSFETPNPYPYSRAEECTWQPEEAARNLSSLATNNPNQSTNDNFYSPSEINSSSTSPGSSKKPTLLSRGWSSSQIPILRGRYGSNSVHEAKGSTKTSRRLAFLKPILHAFSSQLKEPLILMLLASAFLSLCLGNAADAISIAIALSIVSMVAAIQEYRSEQALERLSELAPDTCTVLRDGAVKDNICARELVVGDLVVLATGDRVPADCRLVDGVELKIDESSLTGENRPVDKIGGAIG